MPGVKIHERDNAVTACNRKGGPGVCRDAEDKEGDRIKGRPKSLR